MTPRKININFATHNYLFVVKYSLGGKKPASVWFCIRMKQTQFMSFAVLPTLWFTRQIRLLWNRLPQVKKLLGGWPKNWATFSSVYPRQLFFLQICKFPVNSKSFLFLGLVRWFWLFLRLKSTQILGIGCIITW